MSTNDNCSGISRTVDNGGRRSVAQASWLLGGLGVLAFSFSLPAPVVLGLVPALTATFASLFAGERLPWLFWLATGAGVLVLVTYLLSTSPSGLSGFSLGRGHLWMDCLTVTAGFGGAQAKKIGGAQSVSWSALLLGERPDPWIYLVGVVLGLLGAAGRGFTPRRPPGRNLHTLTSTPSVNGQPPCP